MIIIVKKKGSLTQCQSPRDAIPVNGIVFNRLSIVNYKLISIKKTYVIINYYDCNFFGGIFFLSVITTRIHEHHM